MRKAQPVAEAPAPLVRIAEVLAELGGTSNAIAFSADAEAVAETMKAAVVRDWRGHPCLSWLDAERFFLRTRRDRAEATLEQSERLAEMEGERRQYVGAGVVTGPMAIRRGPAVAIINVQEPH